MCLKDGESVMEEIQVLNSQLPTAVEDLAKYVMVGREKLVALQAELRAIDKMGLVDEIRQQKLLEAQDLADEVLLAEIRLGELISEIPELPGKRTDLEPILDNVADQLLDLLNQLKEEENSFSAMGIDYEEKAFYDILVAVAEKFQFEYPDDKNIELAKEIRAALRDKEKYSDWANSMQIKALMQADIIMILAKHGYPPVPPEIYEKVYSDILEQTENFKKYSDD